MEYHTFSVKRSITYINYYVWKGDAALIKCLLLKNWILLFVSKFFAFIKFLSIHDFYFLTRTANILWRTA
jgi:hypothetical protein